MDTAELLSNIIVYTKYARYLKDKKRRETFEEIVERVKSMHKAKYPHLSYAIECVFDEYVLTKKVLPSMRSMQFAGLPIERNPTRIYNCAYMPIDHPDAFSEAMFLLLGGTGVGYSVQNRHVSSLPVVNKREGRNRRFVIGDSIEGWADAVKVLMESFFKGKSPVIFDYGDIREKGTELVTSGGKAPGPGPLRVCLSQIETVLETAIGRNLSSLEVHDILCYIADAVLAGGIRRAAMIALFDYNDEDMLLCKSGNWWETNPQRGRANNSAILDRNAITEEQFKSIWKITEESGAGEPGIYWTNNLDWGANPCAEIALKPFQFCNLVEVNVSDVIDKKDFLDRCGAASFIATLQAGYTDFHYLRPIWKKTTEEDALIGVGLTGIASNAVHPDWIRTAAAVVNLLNLQISKEININPASRTTTVKPSGTSSLVLKCSSGIHSWHAPYYLRRVRFNKDEDIYKYFLKEMPFLCEDDASKPHTSGIISIPIEAPDGATVREEAFRTLFDRVMLYNQEWIGGGYISGDNRNNVSCTLSVKSNEWEALGNLLWASRHGYNGVAALPFDGGLHLQNPLEEITKDEYLSIVSSIKEIDFSKITEEVDNTNLSVEPACAGGMCEFNV